MTRWLLPILILVMSACTHNENSSTIHSQKRNNEIDISGIIEEFNLGEIIVGKQVFLDATPDNIYLFDIGSPEKMAYVFDAMSGSYKGDGINYGAGPDEISQADIPTVYTYNGKDKIILTDLAQWKIMQYDTDSMIESPDYIPRRLLKISDNNFPSRSKAINDSLILAQKIWLDPNSSKFTKVLEKFNILTGNFESFLTSEPSPASNFAYDVNCDNNLIVTGDYGKDRLLFFDLAGCMIKCILGPEYKSEERLIAFSNIEITDKYILGVYSGCKIVPNMKAYELDMLGKKIVIMSRDGEYLATLVSDSSIQDLKYHENSGKLYLSLTGDTQIGSINLEEVLTGNATEIKRERPDSCISKENKTPVVFFDNNDNPTDLWDLGQINAGGSSHQIVQCDKNSRIEKFEIDTVMVSPDFITGTLGLNFMMPGLITSLTFDIHESAPKGDFKGKVEIYGKGFDSPAVLPISGTVVRR